jgi:hypothetical protein
MIHVAPANLVPPIAKEKSPPPIPSPSRDCVAIGRGGMKEEASAGYDAIQERPPSIRKRKAVSKECRSIKAFSPPPLMEESPPYDSERMPPRPVPHFPNYDTASEGDGKGGGGKGKRGIRRTSSFSARTLPCPPGRLSYPAGHRYE